jgi:hypothetical protein
MGRLYFFFFSSNCLKNRFTVTVCFSISYGCDTHDKYYPTHQKKYMSNFFYFTKVFRFFILLVLLEKKQPTNIKISTIKIDFQGCLCYIWEMCFSSLNQFVSLHANNSGRNPSLVIERKFCRKNSLGKFLT